MRTLTLTPGDILAVERELCRRSLAEFAKRAWHILEPETILRWDWPLDAICAHLEAVTRGEIRRLLMNVPPGSMKSLLTGVIWPAWEWGPRGMPEKRFIGTAHKQELAVRDAMRCRRLIQSQWYQERWPIALTSDQNAKTKFENSATGIREAMAFTSMTGSRGDRIILDDPLSVDDANSSAALRAAEITFTESLPTRINNDESAIVVIMQRLHEQDTSGLILSRGLGYTHLCLPMRFEPSRRCVTPWFTDPRTVEGELMFPGRFSEAAVRELEVSLGSHGSAGQLQQRPTPRGGGILKTAWLQEYRALPAMDWLRIYADTAQKTGQDNDYSVFALWGRSTTGSAYLVDMIRGKWESPELLQQARAFWIKCKTQYGEALSALRVEDKVSGTGLIQTLRREGIPVTAIQRSRDKVSRAHDAAPFMESANVYVPEFASFMAPLLAEIEAFPNGANDDTLDPMFDAIAEVQARRATPIVAPAVGRSFASPRG